MTDRRGSRATWLVGLLDGALLGVPGLIFGMTGIAVILGVVGLSGAVFRNLWLVAGMLVGAGALWTVLLGRQLVLVCSVPVSLSGEGCFPPGLAEVAVFAAGVLLLGVVLTGVAILNRRTAARGS